MSSLGGPTLKKEKKRVSILLSGIQIDKLCGIQMDRLCGIQMAVEYRTIWYPTSFRPFEYQTELIA